MENRNVFANNPIKEKELVDMYMTGKYNTDDLGRYFGVTRQTIRINLIRFGIDVKRKYTKQRYLVNVNVDRIIEMYNDNISIAQIAKQMKVDRSVIEKRLEDNGYDLSIIRIGKKYTGIESAYYSLYKKYKTNAVNRNIPFEILEYDFFELLKNNCQYCGDEPKQIFKVNNRSVFYNGIDRVDNSIGYTKDNCVSCCWICNRFKQNLTPDEMLKHVDKIHKHFKL